MSPKTAAEIDLMRRGGQKLATILNGLAAQVRPGISPKDISAQAAGQIKKAGMQPVVLGYEGFPDVLCISVNQEIVHGIPGNRKFQDGDVVKLDLTLAIKAWLQIRRLLLWLAKIPAPMLNDCWKVRAGLWTPAFLP